MNRTVKRVLVGGLGLVALALGGGGIFVGVNVSASNAAFDKVWDIPVPKIARSTDPQVIARGKHLTESLTACATKDCHGGDLGGGASITMGPLGTFTGPNISQGGMGALYSDGELARLLRHGIKKDGRTLRFMPVQDFSWLPESDRTAIISYLRSAPAVTKANGPMNIGVLGKILDQKGKIVLDVARRIDHGKDEAVPAPEPTAAYGKYLVRLCMGCHGDGLTGGRIPGAPSSLPVPLNLTPHETGLKGWAFEDFDKLANTGVRKNGKPLDPFMPNEVLGKMDEIERRAVFAHLSSMPPKELGNR